MLWVRVEAIRAPDGIVHVESTRAWHRHIEGRKGVSGLPPARSLHADSGPEVRLVLLFDVIPGVRAEPRLSLKCAPVPHH